jgi:hypothetical protein
VLRIIHQVNANSLIKQPMSIRTTLSVRFLERSLPPSGRARIRLNRNQPFNLDSWAMAGHGRTCQTTSRYSNWQTICRCWGRSNSRN